MKYLHKSPNSSIVTEAWHYDVRSQRAKIRDTLLTEQRGYCAYTERYVAPIDALDIEHFDNRLKGTPQDSYWNWYAVHRWVNMHKRSIEHFLPILLPNDPTISGRIEYKNGQFQPIQANDREAQNLIDFLRWNEPTIAAYRNKFVRRMKDLRTTFFADDEAGFVAYLQADPENLNFITVLESELGISLSTYSAR